MDDAEIRRRGAALDEVLNRRLGPGTNRIIEKLLDGPHLLPPRDGGEVAFGIFDVDETLGAMNAASERRKLLKIQQLAGDLAKELRELHPHTYGRIGTESDAVRDLGKNGEDLMLLIQDDPNFWTVFWGAAFVFDELMDKITPAVSDFIDTAPVAGRRNLANIVAIEDLREIWEERKKNPAPMNITEAGPFADFLIEAFEVLGLEGNPERRWTVGASTELSTPKTISSVYRVSVQKSE